MDHSQIAATMPQIQPAAVGIVMLVMFIIQIFFCFSLYSAMKRVDKENHVFPAWFCWLILIPIFGYVFSWMMIPFGVPKTFQRSAGDNEVALKKAKGLKTLGLWQMILFTLALIPAIGLLFGLISLVLWIIYWIKVVGFKRFSLKQQEPPVNN